MSELPPPPPPAPPPFVPASVPPPPSTGTPWWKPRGSWKWWTVTVVAAFIVLVVIVAIVAPPKKPAVAALTNPTPTATAQPTPEPTLDIPTPDGSTANPITPPPTAAPTAVPKAPPTAAPVVGFSKTGRGDSVFTVPAPYNNEPTLVRVKYTGGESNFVVETLGSDNSEEELLVNTIGGFSGVEAMDFDGTSPASRIQVSASGPWTVTLSDPTTAPTFGTVARGRGDAVVAYDGSANTAAFTCNGQDNFVVLQFDDAGDSENLLVNTIGAYSGTVAIDSSGYLVITADGNWSVTLSNS